MNAKQYAGLEKAIQLWMDRACELEDWPELIVGNQTVALMAQAACAVFDACEESQHYAKREGFMKA